MINIRGHVLTDLSGYSFFPKMDLGPDDGHGSRELLKEYPGIYEYKIFVDNEIIDQGECSEREKDSFKKSFDWMQHPRFGDEEE